MFTWLLLAFATLLYSVSAHSGCGTDQHTPHVVQNMNIKPKNIKHSTFEGRAQEPDNSGTYDNIRIALDTSQLESDWDGYDELLIFIDDVIPATYEWLQNVISVRPVDGPLTFDVCNKNSGTTISGGVNDGKCISPTSDWQTCGDTGVIIPADMFDEEEICPGGTNCATTPEYPQGSGMENTDLMIYFSGDASKDYTTDCENVLGYAGPCHSNSRNRPIAGYINLCRVTMTGGVVTWEERIALIIHETFHILGFIEDAFGKFIKEDGSTRTDVWQKFYKRGKWRAVITLPTVVEMAKEFFNCSDMDGIELEDYGKTNGALSSHWDNRIIIHDFMVPYVPQAPSYSSFTLAVLEDSGWYNIDWKYAQEPPQGRGNGCSWYNDKCVADGESIDDNVFCTVKHDYSCGSSYVGNHVCTIATWNTNLDSEYQYFSSGTIGGDLGYPDYCPLYEETNAGDCRLYGANNVGAEWGHGEDGYDAEAAFGGLVSGNSKCAVLSGSINPIGTGCFPTECFINYVGEYVGTRRTHYRNYKHTLFDVVTCFRGEFNVSKELGYVYRKGKDYGFDKIFCPMFEDICYDRNPWICDGHGTILNGSCVCSPGYFGIDCSIENNKVNRNKYPVSVRSNISVSKYKIKVCNGTDAAFDDNYNDEDPNIGILYVVIEGIVDADYVEEYFQIAVKNWIAILTDISQCHVDLRNYNYANNIVKVYVFYYSTLLTWNDVNGNNSTWVFNKLFDSTKNTLTVEQRKESEGDFATDRKVYAYTCAMILAFVAYLL